MICAEAPCLSTLLVRLMVLLREDELKIFRPLQIGVFVVKALPNQCEDLIAYSIRAVT